MGLTIATRTSKADHQHIQEIPPRRARSKPRARATAGFPGLERAGGRRQSRSAVGKVAAYKIERRQRLSGPSTDVGLGIETEITVSNQERGKEWEYGVIAVNKAGEGTPSNTVMTVL